MPKYYLLDTATTGLCPIKDKPVSVALVEIDPITLKPLTMIHCLLNPEKHIPAKATAIHGITDADVKDKYTLKQFCDRHQDVLNQAVVLIAHNLPFDMNFFGRFFTNKVGTIDTLPLARKTYAVELENFKLETLTKHLDLPHGKAHSALHDALACGHLLKHILKKTNTKLNDYIRRI